jgi:hypothetical protein
MSDQLTRLLRAATPTVFILCVISAGAFCDLGVAVLVFAGAALLGAIAALWASLQALTGNVPMTIDEAIALANPAAAEERQRQILQTLKDLEVDFGVGKIGRDDYETLVTECRREAKGLLRATDETSASVRAAAAAYVAEQQHPRHVEKADDQS